MTHNSGQSNVNCLICGSKSNYFFTKKYDSYPGGPFPDKYPIDYFKCDNCGFVISKTHADMSENEWGRLNLSWHHHFESSFEDRTNNQPPYAEQAFALIALYENKLINFDSILDYAAGYGTLAKILKKYFNKNISLFDKYVTDSDSNLTYVKTHEVTKYKTVINSAMFEHILKRADLDEVNDLVDDGGILMLHTVVCERVPKDPNWFYLNPMVHTAFHTNKSMEILMEQWGYVASLYSPQAKSWFLFKKDFPELARLDEVAEGINNEFQTKYFYYKTGFVDFWKGF
jgi:Methyltransferase domain